MLSIERIKKSAKQFARRCLGRQEKYWAERQAMRYYSRTVAIAQKYAPEARSVLDVGSHETTNILRFSWIPSKTAIDIGHKPKIPGVTGIKANFLDYRPDERFDLVTCLQVLEHLDEPTAFAQRLRAVGRTVIVSVPYQWAEGQCVYHKQDPIDEAKLAGWLGDDWLDHEIVEDDGVERLIVVVAGRDDNG